MTFNIWWPRLRFPAILQWSIENKRYDPFIVIFHLCLGMRQQSKLFVSLLSIHIAIMSLAERSITRLKLLWKERLVFSWYKPKPNAYEFWFFVFFSFSKTNQKISLRQTSGIQGPKLYLRWVHPKPEWYFWCPSDSAVSSLMLWPKSCAVSGKPQFKKISRSLSLLFWCIECEWNYKRTFVGQF